MPGALFTIGHSNHPLGFFLGLLRAHAIDAVADVRSMPYSRYNPHFGRERLAQALRAAGVAYVYLGRELGAHSEDPDCYVDGRAQYDRMAQKPLFREGLDRVIRGAQARRIALTCAERDPLSCHRTALIARELHARGVPVTHVLGDGALEAHDRTRARLARELKLERELFESEADLLERAAATHARRIAFVRAEG